MWNKNLTLLSRTVSGNAHFKHSTSTRRFVNYAPFIKPPLPPPSPLYWEKFEITPHNLKEVVTVREQRALGIFSNAYEQPLVEKFKQIYESKVQETKENIRKRRAKTMNISKRMRIKKRISILKREIDIKSDLMDYKMRDIDDIVWNQIVTDFTEDLEWFYDKGTRPYVLDEHERNLKERAMQMWEDLARDAVADEKKYLESLPEEMREKGKEWVAEMRQAINQPDDPNAAPADTKPEPPSPHDGFEEYIEKGVLMEVPNAGGWLNPPVDEDGTVEYKGIQALGRPISKLNHSLEDMNKMKPRLEKALAAAGIPFDSPTAPVTDASTTSSSKDGSGTTATTSLSSNEDRLMDSEGKPAAISEQELHKETMELVEEFFKDPDQHISLGLKGSPLHHPIDPTPLDRKIAIDAFRIEPDDGNTIETLAQYVRVVRLGYKETPEDSAEYRNDEFTDEEEFVEHVEQSEETVEPNLPYDRYTEELLEQDYWNTHFDQRIREIFDPYVEKTLGPGLMKEYRALLPYLGRDVDLGPKHPLKHNIPYSLFQEPAEQVWAEEEVMAIEREHAMDDEELTQRIAKQFKRAGLYLNKDRKKHILHLNEIPPNELLNTLQNQDSLDALTRSYLPKHIREVVGMEEEKEQFDIHSNKQKINLTRDMPFEISSHFFWAWPDKYRERRVALHAKVNALGLSKPAKDRLIAMVGSRYDPQTGVLKLVCDSQRTKEENKYFVKSMMRSLLAEAWKAEPTYLPMDPIPPPEDLYDISFLSRPAVEGTKYTMLSFPVTGWIPDLHKFK